MKILALHTGLAKDIATSGSAEWWDKEWRTGFYKEPKDEAVWLGYEGFQGDEQADRKHHGGVDKAVCVYAAERYPHWRMVLTTQPLPFGAFGENLTTEGATEEDVCIGDVWQIGEALVQISQPRQPCWKLARRWQVRDLSAQVERTGYTGFYFRVLRHGRVQKGDTGSLQERAWPEWTIQRCNEIMHHQRQDKEAAVKLSTCPALSGSWKDSLWRRGQTTTSTADEARRAARLGL